MKQVESRTRRRGSVLLMIVGLLAMLFMVVTAYIAMARFDRQTTIQVGHGQQIEQTIKSLNDMLCALIRGGEGGALATGAGYADIPGYGDSSWLGSLEPVRDPDENPDQPLPKHYKIPGVTSLAGDAAIMRLTALMLDRPDDQDKEVTVDPFNPNAPFVGGRRNDTRFNARLPLTDADGDGVADSYFGDGGANGGVAVATELANAIGGSAVRTQGINLAGIPDPLAGDPAWVHFNERARYIAAVRVISHGGMVFLGSSAAPAWNREFVYGMFNWLKNPEDTDSLNLLHWQNEDLLLRRVTAASATIEPRLRARGGLLIGEHGDDLEFLPPALRELQERFYWTLTPNALGRWLGQDPALKLDGWQRFNLAWVEGGRGGGEWEAWRRAISLDPDLYNLWYEDVPASTDPREAYVQRHLLTTVNNSDELAREQNEHYKRYASGLPGIDAGDLKFYLGDVAQAFDPTTGAFLGGEGWPGTRIVGRLAGYYHEMLAGYQWRNTEAGEINEPEASKRHKQAHMLAVNTVAFAAPRMASGWIDNVWYTDDTSDPPTTYVGYAPQPFITQVMAFKEPTDKDIALAVELYNPNERQPSSQTEVDPQALYLPQFGLSLNDEFELSGFNRAVEPSTLRPLDNIEGNVNFPRPPRLSGREFMTVILDDLGGNKYFQNNITNGSSLPRITELAVKAPQGSSTITVKLWRKGTSGPGGQVWILVDEFEIKEPVDSTAEPWEGSWFDAWRDTYGDPYWGLDLQNHAARWRCAVAFPRRKWDGITTEPHYKWAEDNNSQPHEPPGGANVNRLDWLGQQGPQATGTEPYRFGPAVPLYTMNAALVQTDIHGSLRPASFPTVGFLAFVPRFSHIYRPFAGINGPKPMTSILYDQWDNSDGDGRDYDLTAATPRLPPADFGHVALFDNTQLASPKSDFLDAKTGRIPWGLLVFDYFTTVEPYVEGLDPYRVPGRININAAPWYLLAGLPVIGPVNGNRFGNLPLSPSASPAFWSAASGVLAGPVNGGTVPRFDPGQRLIGRNDAVAVKPEEVEPFLYRLGPYLAQAAASYRDRVAYTSNAPARLLQEAWRRNDNTAEPGAYRPAGRYGPVGDPYAGIRGGGSSNLSKRGFLSLGELANVVGFDSSTDPELLGGPNGTALGQRDADFFRAVSLLALLDTHFLTTRSNTFTVYATLTDRENPQASVRSQLTVDRSKLLPRRVGSDIIQSHGLPEMIGQRDVAYFNARYDD